MAEQHSNQMKKQLTDAGIPAGDAAKILTYINSARRAEQGKESSKQPVTNNTDDQIVGMALKYYNLGLLVDGVNVIISGRNMAMVTFNGYKNKVLTTYPETEFDIQLVREGDTFHVAKESGSVVYSHDIGDPFASTEAPIIGAYCVFKNKRGEFIETLNQTDYEKMKKASKQQFLWGEWASEFWLKSVIKRACKRHFYDVVAEIDKNDNEDYGAVAGDRPAPEADNTDKTKQAIAALKEARDLDELKRIFVASGLMQNADVVAAKDAKKDELMAMPPTKTIKTQTTPQEPTDEN